LSGFWVVFRAIFDVFFRQVFSVFLDTCFCFNSLALSFHKECVPKRAGEAAANARDPRRFALQNETRGQAARRRNITGNSRG
jgi:hypothetical protein